ncbi:MAG: hypothetical protein GY940_32805 [bacterium]|nr:hypothetical protein [bacterium]
MSGPKELKEIDFLYMRESVYDLERVSKPDPEGNYIFPLLTGETIREEDTVEVGDVLKTTLSAIDSATRRLRAKGISLAGEPIEIKLTGSLVGISPNADRILIRVKPEGKGGT